MKKISLIVLFVVAISFLSFENIIGMNIEEKLERRLKLLNKPAVKSIKSEDGDIIDCVNIYNQPAFDHPLFKNHTVEMTPPAYLTRDITIKKISYANVFASQTWKRSGSCPKGTIPIRRVRKQDILRAASLENFGRKTQHVYDTNGSPFYRHSAAFVLTSSYNFSTAQGDIKVENPQIDLSNDYSSSQIWVKHDEEYIESGWIVNPQLYGDTKTRFFGSWTVDSHQATGCFDHHCAGFVQVNKDIALGAAISEVAKQEGSNTILSISLDLDKSKGNWWLSVNNIAIGYWPKELLNKLYHSAKEVQWGGEVYSEALYKSPHTKTDMGSGKFSRVLYYGASFIEYIKVKYGDSMQLKDPPIFQVYQDEFECYNALYDTTQGRPVLFYGGPGGDNEYCY